MLVARSRRGKLRCAHAVAPRQGDEEREYINVFSARLQHFWFGVAFLLAYMWIKRQRQEGGLLLHPLALAVALPILYLGSALPDWDIKLLGIGAHRNPLFHSAAAYFCLAYLGRWMGLERTVHNAAGIRLRIAAQVGFALGLW